MNPASEARESGVERAVEPVRIDKPGTMLDVIRTAAADPKVDVVKMQALLEMKKDLEAEQRRIEFQESLSRVQQQIPVVPKSGTIDLGNKGSIRYAKFEDIQEIVKPILRDEGFTVTYDEQKVDDNIKQIVVTLSRAGHSESYKTFVPWSDAGPGRNATQAMISASSYARRRALVYALDISIEGEDNDGAGDLSRIDEQQVSNIEDLLAASGADREAFLSWLTKSCRVDKVEDILARDYDRVVKMLQRKIDKGAK